MRALVVIFVGGLLFGFGLALSGLVEQEIVLSFLQLEDLGLALTMGAALVVCLPVYQALPRRRRRPPLGASYEHFPKHVTRRNLIGGAVFGIGWGVSGVCPGAAIASLGTGNWPVLAALLGMLAGAYLQGVLLPERRPVPAAAPA